MEKKTMKYDEIVQREDEAIPVTSSFQAYHYLQRYAQSDVEQFIVMTLDSGNYPISCRIVSKGTISNTLVHQREVFRGAILDNAGGIIIAHNHTNKNLYPSKEDFLITKKMLEASIIMGIQLCDHMILGKDTYMSFTDEKIMEKVYGKTYINEERYEQFVDKFVNKMRGKHTVSIKKKGD